MTSDPGIGAGTSTPWYRVVAIPDVSYGGSPERDYASMLPALLDAAQNHRTFVTGWLSRGGGAPLEFVQRRAAAVGHRPVEPPLARGPGRAVWTACRARTA